MSLTAKINADITNFEKNLDKAIKQSEDEDRKKIKKDNTEKLKALNKVKNEN